MTNNCILAKFEFKTHKKHPSKKYKNWFRMNIGPNNMNLTGMIEDSWKVETKVDPYRLSVPSIVNIEIYSTLDKIALFKLTFG